jgi:hypothetical protein
MAVIEPHRLCLQCDWEGLGTDRRVQNAVLPLYPVQSVMSVMAYLLERPVGPASIRPCEVHLGVSFHTKARIPEKQLDKVGRPRAALPRPPGDAERRARRAREPRVRGMASGPYPER